MAFYGSVIRYRNEPGYQLILQKLLLPFCEKIRSPNRVSDPYTFFTDPDTDPDTDPHPDPIRIQGFKDQKLKKK
jgi:hypothetical protein